MGRPALHRSRRLVGRVCWLVSLDRGRSRRGQVGLRWGRGERRGGLGVGGSGGLGLIEGGARAGQMGRFFFGQ